jgi:dephospho-CoA kinase
VRLRRIMERDQVNEEQARQAIAAQMPLEEKTRLADQCIDNSRTWQNTRAQVHKFAAVLRQRTIFSAKNLDRTPASK